MTRACALTVAMLVLAAALPTPAGGQAARGPETVVVHNGPITLHAMLWRPLGHGPFPAILLNHGSGRSREELERLGPYEEQAQILGPVFDRHGYVFLFPFRQGVGLSADQGPSAIDLMIRELAAHGENARNVLQLRLLENRELSDAAAALAFLRGLPEVDKRKVAIVGHSFGGSLDESWQAALAGRRRAKELMERRAGSPTRPGSPRPRRRSHAVRRGRPPPCAHRRTPDFGGLTVAEAAESVSRIRSRG